MELYGIRPSGFPEINPNLSINVQVVSEDNETAFLDLNYKHSLDYGKNYADQKRELLKRQLKDTKHVKVLAYYEGEPAGYVHLIQSDDTVEIDDLHVDDEFQKKGIGSALQQFVMSNYPEKIVILIADGEDTPREMYQKQNYQYVGLRYEVLRTF
nr:GNAT family N-acetyltransferase [Evansella tamaricis]